MGVCISRSKESEPWEKDPKVFVHKMKLLNQEINAILEGREEESEAYERELMLFAVKEAEWKKERKKLKDEVKKTRKRLEEKEEKIKMMEDEVDQIVGKNNNNGQFEGKSSVGHSSCVTGGSVNMSLMEQMKEERARRDETVEKWKMLYLAIKNELDELIHKTHQGTLNWRGEEDLLVQEMQRELKAKDEIIEVLKAQIVSLESEAYKRKTEVDILRQSLKIINSKKGPTSVKHVKSRSRTSIRLNKSLSKLAFVN